MRVFVIIVIIDQLLNYNFFPIIGDASYYIIGGDYISINQIKYNYNPINKSINLIKGNNLYFTKVELLTSSWKVSPPTSRIKLYEH